MPLLFFIAVSTPLNFIVNFARHLGKVARLLIFEASLWHVLLLRALIEGSSGRCLQIWTHPVSIDDELVVRYPAKRDPLESKES